MGKILTLSGIEKVGHETFDYMKYQTVTLVGTSHLDGQVEHLHTLTGLSQPHDSTLSEIAILVMGDEIDLPNDKNSILKINTEVIDLVTVQIIGKACVVYLDCRHLPVEALDPNVFLCANIRTDLFILVGCVSDEVVGNLLISGVKWVISLDEGAGANLLSMLLDKVMLNFYLHVFIAGDAILAVG